MAEMRNLMHDPWPSRLSWGYVGGGAQDNMALRMTNDKTGIHITTLATPPAWVGLWVTGMTPGKEYVAAIIFDGEPITLLAKDEIAGPRIAQVECTQPKNCYMIRFTPAGNRALVIVITPSTVNAASAIKQFSVMSGEDWDNMRNLKNSDGSTANIRWFAPPKTAATGVLSVPALDRGGALLILLAVIHTLMWRRQHDGDTESGARPSGHQTPPQLADDVCGRLVHGRGNRRHTAKPDLCGTADSGGRHTGRTARIGYAGDTCRQRAGLDDAAALAGHRQPVPARREHDHANQQCALDQLHWPHLPGAYPRVGMVHARRLGALQNALDGREVEQPALAPTGHGDRGLTAAASACAVTLTSRWEVAA